MPTTDNTPRISLHVLGEKHYQPLLEAYDELSEMDPAYRVYEKVVRLHFRTIQEIELQKVEVVNEKIFRGIDDFRAYLESEIEKLGPLKNVQEKVLKLIGVNKRLRSHRGVHDGHELWSENSYLYSQQDARDAFIKLHDDEWKRCRGQVIAENMTTWQIIDIPSWVNNYRLDGGKGRSASNAECPTNIEHADVEKYKAELNGYITSQDRASVAVAELVLIYNDLTEKGDYLDRSLEAYKTNVQPIAAEIFGQKQKVLSLWRMRTQIERLEEENNRYS